MKMKFVGENEIHEKFGSLNDRCSLWHWNAWPLVGGTVCKVSGGVAMLEEVCHWRWVSKV